MKRLTKEMLEEMGVTNVRIYTPGFIPVIEINYKRAKISKRDTITVNKLNSPLRAYKGVKKAQRTSIPVGRVVIAWYRGYIEANEIALEEDGGIGYEVVPLKDYQWLKKEGLL